MRKYALLAVWALAGWAPPAQGQVPAGRAVFDAARLEPRSDTFEIRVGGSAVGTQVVALDRSPDGFVFRETTTMPGVSQTTEVRFGGDLRMGSVRQEGRMGGAEMRIDVVYADGRASGTARVPGPDGMRSIEVDADVPADAVDDNVLVSLLPALPWAPGAVWTVPVFASGRGELVEYTVRAGPEGTTATPAGSYRTYEVQVTGGEQALVLQVTVEAPHAVVGIAVPGSPLEIVRSSRLPEGEPR